jgi:hypothetical protein
MAVKSLVSIPSGFVPSPATSASITASVRVTGFLRSLLDALDQADGQSNG